MFRDIDWWDTEEGIFDARRQCPFQNPLSEGGRFRAALKACMVVLAKHTCEFKIGMARSLGIRWVQYKNTDGWQPTHLWLLLEVEGRVAAGYAESGLISKLQDAGLPLDKNINFKNGDHGGTGPRPSNQMFDTYFVYLAVKANTCM